MSVESWAKRNASLRAAHEKYGDEFVSAHSAFRPDDPLLARSACVDHERIEIWDDYANCGERIVQWFRKAVQ